MLVHYFWRYEHFCAPFPFLVQWFCSLFHPRHLTYIVLLILTHPITNIEVRCLGWKNLQNLSGVYILKIYIILSFSEILTELLPKYYKEVLLKVDIFCSLLNQALEHLGSLKVVPRSTQEHGAKALWVIWAPCHYALKCSLALMSAVGAMAPCSWGFMVAYECS